ILLAVITLETYPRDLERN
ncbi:hypothetical protein TNCV_2789291, partial [Trichonephila clavipes]